jgi:uncharacterized protein (TIGR02679 family)
MHNNPDPRLIRLLGGDALAALRKRLRQRYERGENTSTFRLGDLTNIERTALASLLGRRQRLASSMSLAQADLDAALHQAGIAASLRDALEQLDGPIVDRAAERATFETQWASLFAINRDPRLAALLAEVHGLRLIKRLARNVPATGTRLLDAAQAVLLHLPTSGITRSRLAAEALGDAHALDQGRPEATLVLAVLRLHLSARGTCSMEPEISEHTSAKKDNPQVIADESDRAVWASAGVLVNELARPALFLNLPRSDGPVRIQAPSEPSYLSLRELLRSPPRWDVACRDVYVCENPNLIAIAADALGHHCAPLVCTDGMPGAAQRTLLLQLAEAGAHLNYHGDFDWPGLRIGNWVMRACGARPWRYGAEEYLAAANAIHTHGRALEAATIEADWDKTLAQTMRACGWAIDEEAVATTLLQDLGARGISTIAERCSQNRFDN